jgi:outer membrane protein assembly factor BamB
MKTIRQRSLELERKVLRRLEHPPRPPRRPAVAATRCVIVSPEYREGAERLDCGAGWHDLSAADQRACQIAFATLELREGLRRITGVTLPIVYAPNARRTNIELIAEDGDEFEVTRPAVLKGNLLYAVYHFLETQGCRWYGLGAEEQILPQRETILLPSPTRQAPSFPLRFFHSHLENRASAAMLDWFGKARLNLWGADNDQPGQRARCIRLHGGRRWSCRMGLDDCSAMARSFFLPAPFVTELADALPKLAERKAQHFPSMHLQNGYWGVMQPMYYLMSRLLWDETTDVAATLAAMLRDLFGRDAPAAARCLFALERAALPCFWGRSQAAKRLALLTLQDRREPFWCWGGHLTREEFFRIGDDLAAARHALAEMQDTVRSRLWEQQAEYAGTMHQLYVHAIEAYEAARRDGRWHFSNAAARHFGAAMDSLRALAAVDVPRWSRSAHYYPRSLPEQTGIGPALERMGANLGITLPPEASPPPSPRGTVWTHGAEHPLRVGLGNYQWAQPYVANGRVFVTGQDRESSPQRSILRCLDLEDGAVVWERVCEDAGHSALFSTYLGIAPDSVIARECHKNPERGSALVRLDAATGVELWRVEDPPDWEFGGNGAALVLDLDGDGRLEVIDSAVAHVACIDLETGRLKWRYADHVRICHGVTAAGDVDGDGRLELAIGGEYNEHDRDSSVQVLRADGSLLWKSSGHPHDLGSTRAFVLDVDGDGKAEVLHASLDLLGDRRLPTSDFYCWNADGALRYRVPFGCREASLADFDGDGRLEVIGITSGRDGGFSSRPAIVCLEAATGTERWRTPIPRHYLDDDLRVVADFDGDGLPEALLFTAHQSGYGHVPGQPCWCDAYVVKGTGAILWKVELEDLSYAALVGDAAKPDSLVIATGNGLIRRVRVALSPGGEPSQSPGPGSGGPAPGRRSSSRTARWSPRRRGL